MTIHHHLHEQSDPHLQLEALVQPFPQEQDPERNNILSTINLANFNLILLKLEQYRILSALCSCSV